MKRKDARTPLVIVQLALLAIPVAYVLSSPASSESGDLAGIGVGLSIIAYAPVIGIIELLLGISVVAETKRLINTEGDMSYWQTPLSVVLTLIGVVGAGFAFLAVI